METQAEYKVSSEQTDLDNVLEKINEIAKESATGDYIYRGEPAHYQEHPYNGRVTSSLYRQYLDIEAEHFDVAVVQADILRAAHEYTPRKMEDFELLATLQHYGDKTNLIDFTTDYLVALFFACDGEPAEPGRVILLQRPPEVHSKPYEVKEPPRTIGRAEAQKSIFVQAEKGFVEPDRIVTIPARLKAALLDYLRKHHDISTKTIYNDLQGFIENRGLHKNADTEFYKGLTFQGRVDSAKTKEEKQKWYDAAITHYTEAINLNPEYADAYNNRGIAYGRTGDFAAAIEDFNKAIDLAPENASCYNNRGLAYAGQNDFAAAIEDFNKAIDLAPKNASCYNSRGLAYAGQNDFAAAIRDYDKAIDLAPEDASCYNHRGLAYAGQNDFAAAIRDYDKAIDLAPEDAGVYNNRGITYDTKGEYDRAIQDFNKAIELNPELTEPYTNLGRIYRAKRSFDESILYFSKAIAVDPENASCYNYRGIAYATKDELDKAMQDFNKAIELNPTYADAYSYRGMAWLQRSKWENAQLDLTAATVMGIDIAASFHNVFGSIEAFEAKLGVKIPKDIVALLQRA